MLDIFNITRSSHILKERDILMLWYCQILPALSPKCSMKQIKHTKQIPSPTIWSNYSTTLSGKNLHTVKFAKLIPFPCFPSIATFTNRFWNKLNSLCLVYIISELSNLIGQCNVMWSNSSFDTIPWTHL